jgi:hypothetical protein
LFGPFIKLPPGSYRVEFDVSMMSGSLGSERLIFDVATPSGSIARSPVLGRDFDEPIIPALEFDHVDDDSPLEFRVHCQRWAGRGSLLFRGVRLFKLPHTGEVPVFSFQGTRVEAPERMTIRQRISNFVFGGVVSSSSALFSQADQARDRGDWTAAAKLYDQGLVRDSSNFHMMVQLANCLKEAGQYWRAERFYKRALSFAPTDADIFLQLGHLSKLRGRRAEALAYYARSLSLSRAGAIATEEIEMMPPLKKIAARL